jgi:hypothetical protein
MTRHDVASFIRVHWVALGISALAVIAWVTRMEAMAKDYGAHKVWADTRNDLLVEVKRDVDGISRLVEAGHRLDCWRARYNDGEWDLLVTMGVPCQALLGNRIGGNGERRPQ